MAASKLPAFIGVISDADGKVIARAGASSKPLAAARAMRSAIEHYMEAKLVHHDARSSSIGPFDVGMVARGGATYVEHYRALQYGNKHGLWHELE